LIWIIASAQHDGRPFREYRQLSSSIHDVDSACVAVSISTWLEGLALDAIRASPGSRFAQLQPIQPERELM
jgi:hypothetical protein